MTDPRKGASTPIDFYSHEAHLGRKVPTREELYLIPPAFVACLSAIAPKIQASGAWWALAGDVGENLLDVHVRPSEIEVVTDKEGLDKIFLALSAYDLTPIATKERQLEREGEPDDKKYPVYVRSTSTGFSLNDAKVSIHADYQMKVGEWEWGDPFMFEPVYVNLAGLQIPVMPLRLRSEIYLLLGWGDRAQLISEATSRAHAFLKMFGGGM